MTGKFGKLASHKHSESGELLEKIKNMKSDFDLKFNDKDPDTNRTSALSKAATNRSASNISSTSLRNRTKDSKKVQQKHILRNRQSQKQIMNIISSSKYLPNPDSYKNLNDVSDLNQSKLDTSIIQDSLIEASTQKRG